MNRMAGVALISPCQPKGENVKIIRVESCRMCPNLTTYPSGSYACSENNWLTFSDVDVFNNKIHPDCPLPDEADHEG
jgi:hypothetical protein